MKPLALDLFCGGGGAAAGLQAAGFEVVGLDINPTCAKYYPGHFIQADISNGLLPVSLEGWDLVWASPPCQKFSRGTRKANRPHLPDLMNLTRSLLRSLSITGSLTVIENVPGPHIRADINLTGQNVGLNKIIRKRSFELSFTTPLISPPTRPPAFALSINKWRASLGLPTRIPKDEAMEAMGITHNMTTKMIGEAVPPAYAELIARQARKLLEDS